MTSWYRFTTRGFETTGPGFTSPSTPLVGGSPTTGPDSSNSEAGNRPAYAETEPRDARARRRARIRAS